MRFMFIVKSAHSGPPTSTLTARHKTSQLPMRSFCT
jgi:hypothetical protein